MTEKIQTRPFIYGDEKEGSWPPRFGTGESGVFHLNEKGECIAGYPPRKTASYGQAPYVITDTIDAHYHHGACQWTESKSKIRHMDEATGTITTDKQLPHNPHPRRQRLEERHKDLHNSMHRAVAQIDAGTAPLSEETRQLCEKQNEIVSKALNFDAFNVAGRKKDGKGKKFRK